MKTTILLISFLIFSAYTFSQNDSVLSVDYGKTTLSPDIVPQWKVQAEVGGTALYSEYDYFFLPGTEYESAMTDYSLLLKNPSLALRLGIFKNIEFSLGFVFIQELYGSIPHRQDYHQTRHGIYSGGPIEAGLKYKFLNESKYLPKAAVSVKLFIPAGDFYFHMDYVSPFFNLMVEKNISKVLSFGVNAGYGWTVYDNYTDKYGTASLSINTQLSRRLTAFAEASGIFQNKRLPDQRLGAGIIFRFSKNVTAVASGGFGVSSIAPELFGSGGIGLMFP